MLQVCLVLLFKMDIGVDKFSKDSDHQLSLERSDGNDDSCAEES